MALSAAEKQAAYRDRKRVDEERQREVEQQRLHDEERDRYAEALARETSAQINARRQPTGREVLHELVNGAVEIPRDDVEERVKRAVKHAKWLEEQGLPYR